VRKIVISSLRITAEIGHRPNFFRREVHRIVERAQTQFTVLQHGVRSDGRARSRLPLRMEDLSAGHGKICTVYSQPTRQCAAVSPVNIPYPPRSTLHSCNVASPRPSRKIAENGEAPHRNPHNDRDCPGRRAPHDYETKLITSPGCGPYLPGRRAPKVGHSPQADATVHRNSRERQK
jgi:hypothetical protein